MPSRLEKIGENSRSITGTFCAFAHYMSYTKEKPRADQIVFGFHKIVGGVLSVMLGLWATLASASQVILQLPPDAQGLDGHLRAASLSIVSAAQDDATPQDIMAAARADYGRLTAALYQGGH